MEKKTQVHRVTFYFKPLEDKDVSEERFLNYPHELFFEFGELGVLWNCNISKLKYLREGKEIIAGGAINHQYSFQHGMSLLEGSPYRFKSEAIVEQSLIYVEDGEDVVDKTQVVEVVFSEAVKLLKSAKQISLPQGHTFHDEVV